MVDLFRFFRKAPIEKPKDLIFIRQSDWTPQLNASLVKKWGINGLLDSGDELEVIIDVTFSKSNISNEIEPHVFIYIWPNTFGNVEGFITIQIACTDALAEYPFVSSHIGLTESGSIIVSLTDLKGAKSAFGVLSDMKKFRIWMLDEKETIFEVSLPNDTNNFSEIAGISVQELLQ